PAPHLRDLPPFPTRRSSDLVLWLDGQRYVSPTCHLDVVDRIGGGDGFAAGLIYGLISGRPPEEALRLGWAHGALLTTFPGDITIDRKSTRLNSSHGSISYAV